MKRTVLVTGGAGYLGSVLVGELLRLGYRVRVLDILMFGKESLSGYLNSPQFELVVGDIRDEGVVRKSMKDVFAVCHLAALVGEPACKLNPKLSKEINLLATECLAKKAKRSGVQRFIFTSTCSNYGITEKDQKVDESYPLRALSIYSQTKIDAESRVIASKNSTLSTTVLRLGTLYGISPRMRFNLLVNQLARDAYYNKKLTIYEPNVWRPNLHVEDAVSAITMLLGVPVDNISAEVFNVVGENKRKLDILDELRKHFPEVKVEIDLERGKDKRDYRVNGGKIRKMLNFKPKRKIKDGVAEIKKALDKGVFKDPYNDIYTLWLDETFFK